MIEFSTYLLQPGYTLSVTTPATSAGQWRILEDGTNANTVPTTISANTTITIGPYTSSRRIGINNASSIIMQFYDLASAFAGTAIATNLTAIPDLADDATGATIATTVNGIIAALVAAGILEASE